ncbi:MAG: hypothetical protein ABI585_14955 [Betaproteobacteria bacterium]
MDPHELPRTLDDRLAALQADFAALEPPPSADRAVAVAILRASRRRARASPGSRRIERWLAWPVALAAAIGLVAVAVRQLPDAAIHAAAAPATSRFMPVVPVAEIERSTDAYVVPARMPRMALAQFGLPVNPARAGEAIDTELLVRPDGAVLALRFVN